MDFAQKSIKDTDCGSESLPTCWNEDGSHYSLRYVLGNDVYILTCLIIDDSTAIFNLFNVAKGTVSNISFELRDVMTYCSDMPKKKLVELMPKIDVHILRIREELILPVAGCYNCSNDTKNKRPDPVPPQRSQVDFKCLPNFGCPWPTNMAFGMPNKQALMPVDPRNPCCLRQQLATRSCIGGGQTCGNTVSPPMYGMVDECCPNLNQYQPPSGGGQGYADNCFGGNL